MPSPNGSGSHVVDLLHVDLVHVNPLHVGLHHVSIFFMS